MKPLAKIYKDLRMKLFQAKDKNKEAQLSNFKEKFPDYFTQASNWATDFQTQTMLSRNRYRLAFITSLLLSCSLVLLLSALFPLEHFKPLLVHHYEDGVISVDPINMSKLPQSKALVESEITRYIQARESYDPSSYSSQYQLVNLMSDQAIFRRYQLDQNGNNPQSMINQLNNKFTRRVRVESIVFLQWNEDKKEDKSDRANLAEVNFSTIDVSNSSGKRVVSPFVVTLSWKHLGIPNDPQLRWRNWDGFVVSNYQLVQRSLVAHAD
jgi:type IV secretion system protein VirB8